MSADAERLALLAHLRDSPADVPAWLILADWLDDRDDPAGPFIRLSLEITEGRVGAEALAEYERLYPLADAEIRELMAAYRSALPARFRVTQVIRLGEKGLTIGAGYLESGEVQRGMDLGIAPHADGRPRVVFAVEVFARTLDSARAGREPFQVALAWNGCPPLEAGDVLSARG